MSYFVREIDPENIQDAERVAAMFNDFDSAWPGGFNRGMDETAAHVQERKRRFRRLAMLVVEHEGEFVGYCDLEAQQGQKEVAYIPLLGARLSHHGKGVGKMLLREMVRRVTELGYKQLTLHTWPGNTKAVPLYKKTGFNWVPETHVFMQNYLPTALTIPAGKAFFANRDWYAVFDREIVVAPDDAKWRGMKSFTYRFRDGDDFLNLVFDAASEGLTALETPAYSVACCIPVEEAAAGETCPITWEITPRGGKPLDVVLLAESSDGLDVRVQERLTVQRETTITRDVKISPDARPRRQGEKAHHVRTTLLIDGQAVTLETGVKVEYPVEIEYNGQGLFPGREEKVTVTLWSHLDRPLTGRLALDAHPAIRCGQPSQEFTLPPRLKTQCEFTITATEPGTHLTRLRFEAGETRGSRPIAFRAFNGNAALASIDAEFEDRAFLESPGLQVGTDLRGGHLWIHDPVRHRGLIGHNMAALGPPFMEEWQRPPIYTARVDKTAHGTTLVTSGASRDFPGLLLERSVSLLGDNVARIEYRVSNTTDLAQPIQIRMVARGWLNGHLVLPTVNGLIREPQFGWGEYPSGDVDILAQDGAMAEEWAACEEDGLVCGVVWPKGPKQDMQWNRFPNQTYDLGKLPPHSSQTLPPLYLIAGSGNWETVRGWWRRLSQPSGVVEDHAPEPIRVLEVRAAPNPALLLGDSEDANITVVNTRGKDLTGTLTLSGKDAFQVEPTTFALEKVNRDRPFVATTRLAAPDAPSAGFLQAAIDNGPTTETFQVPVVRLGSGGEMRVTQPEEGQIVVENGLLTLRVAPAFLGSLYALERNGVNHLFSSYPESRPFVWVNPWFGGVHLSLGWRGNPLLTKEKFSGEPIERTGERGLKWTGVRVACQPAHKDLRWVHIEAEYLTLPGSNVVALVNRWTNLCDAKMETPGDSGMTAWLQVGGERQNAVGHWERNGERRHRRRGGFALDGRSQSWAAVENSATGDALMLIATDPRAHTNLEDFGEEGPHIVATGPVNFEPHETKETLSWLVLPQSMEQAAAYAALAKIRRLP